MKVLMVHNRYQQSGGEDAVVDAEVGLLATNGIEVSRFDVDNDAIQGLIPKIRTSIGQFGIPTRTGSQFRKTLERFRPDVVHVHNWLATLSPSVFNICRGRGIPVVHTLHNYRLLCASATLFRDGHVCEDCIGSATRLPGIVHACYRNSRTGTAVVTAAMLAHWSLGTWTRSVGRFIALTQFARTKLIQGGLPAEKIIVKPNFVDPDPGMRSSLGGYLLYAGRLTEEKGLRVLFECWKGSPELPLLKIAGAGPLLDELREAAASLPNVHLLGPKAGDEVIDLMRNADALLCPSQWYEGMPRVVIESLAVGTPVIASRIGCYPEMIVDGETGALFTAGDPNALRTCIHNMIRSRALAPMRPNARRSFQANYTGESNLPQLLNVYRSVLRAEKVAASQPVPART